MALITNLVSYWKLDESSGNAADSVGSNTLTNNNSVSYTTGKINNGAVFVRASSKSLSVTDNASLSLTGDLTISAWVNFASTPTSGNYFGIVAKLEGSPNYSYAFYLYNNAGTPEITFQNSTNGTAVTQKGVAWTPTTSTWYHIAAVYTASAGSVKFYVNGAQRGSTQTGLGTSIFDSTSTFYIGRYDGGNYFDGSIDEAGIWSRVLTTVEIAELYNNAVGLQYDFTSGNTVYGLTSYWKLDESSGNASDAIGGNTLTNNNTVTFSSGKINNGANLVKASSQSFSVADGSQTGLDIADTVSISLWIKLTQLPSTAGVFFSLVGKSDDNFDGGYRVFIDTSDKINFLGSASGNHYNWKKTTSAALVSGDVGNWKHIVVTQTCSANTMAIYVDNSSLGLTNVQANGTGIDDVSYPFRVGGHQQLGTAYQFFDGSIDEVGIWPRVLSSTEVGYLYNSAGGRAFPLSLLQNLTMAAGIGSFTLTGYDAGVGRVLTLIASVGNFVLTGIDVVLRKTGWTNQTKNTASFTNATKHTSTFSNRSKNTSSWTNRAKH